MRILGIDPGLAPWVGALWMWARHAALCCLRHHYNHAGHPLPQRLVSIRTDENLLARYKPDHIVFEELFFARNVTTAFT